MEWVMEIYVEHFLAGLMFAVTGAYARNFCRHTWHQIVVGATLVAIESAIVVTFIG